MKLTAERVIVDDPSRLALGYAGHFLADDVDPLTGRCYPDPKIVILGVVAWADGMVRTRRGEVDSGDVVRVEFAGGRRETEIWEQVFTTEGRGPFGDDVTPGDLVLINWDQHRANHVDSVTRPRLFAPAPVCARVLRALASPAETGEDGIPPGPIWAVEIAAMKAALRLAAHMNHDGR